MAFNWTCPYCNTKTTINSDNFKTNEHTMLIDNAEGKRKLRTEWIVCPNNECRRITMTSILYDWFFEYGEWVTGDIISHWRLLPGSHAKAFPDYIPKPLRIDYEEASAIIDKSPKSSATLARRCLQGIIRDFWGIKKGEVSR